MIPNDDVFAANDGKHYLCRREVKVSSDGPRREVGGAGSSLGVEAACGEAAAALGLADISTEAITPTTVGTIFGRNAPHCSQQISKH